MSSSKRAPSSQKMMMTASSPLMALAMSSQSFGIRYHQLWHHYRDGTIQEIEAGWDGSEENAMPSTKAYYKVYVQELAATVEDNLSRPSDSETDVEDYKNGKRLTRQEKKAIEKELSYRDILSQSEDYIQDFIKSAQKEETSFMEWKSLKPVPPDETEKILADPELKKRVITSRQLQTLRVVQQTFIEGLEMGRISKKVKKTDILSPEHWPEFRSISGCLQPLTSGLSLCYTGSSTHLAPPDQTGFGEPGEVGKGHVKVKASDTTRHGWTLERLSCAGWNQAGTPGRTPRWQQSLCHGPAGIKLEPLGGLQGGSSPSVMDRFDAAWKEKE
eukprot:g4589.t1